MSAEILVAMTNLLHHRADFPSTVNGSDFILRRIDRPVNAANNGTGGNM